MSARTAGTALAFALLLALIWLPLGLDPQGYPIRVFTLIFLFAAMAQSWNIVGGLANQMSLGHAAFFGIGAYTSTLLLIHAGVSPWLGMGAAEGDGTSAGGFERGEPWGDGGAEVYRSRGSSAQIAGCGKAKS